MTFLAEGLSKLQNLTKFILSLVSGARTALGSIPSGIFALFYLLAIPLFAQLYSASPGEFYHSTLSNEPETTKTRLHVFEPIRRKISLSIEQYVEREMKMQVHPLGVASGRFDPALQNYSFAFAFEEVRQIDDVSEEKQLSQIIGRIHFLSGLGLHSVGMNGSPEERERSNGSKFVPISLAISDVSWIPVSEIFSTPGPVLPVEVTSAELLFPSDLDAFDEYYSTIEISVSEISELRKLHGLESGFPIDSQDRFSRMLYFSAVTITTLGYGDIVPLTNRARRLVALQSVLGIVLVGLFLNSLARNWG